jgi:ferric-dicitrate binding protein FerR (iron transport regulator)
MESLIRKFVKNEASEDDIEVLQEYFKTPIGLKHLEQIIDEFEGDFNNTHLTRSSYALEVTRSSKENNGVSSPFKRRMISAIAASFIGIAILSCIYFYNLQAHSLIVYETVAGQKTAITLPDGTIVNLNGSSSLSYYDDTWKEGKLRAVTLTGEGYFKVTSNPKKPFVVNTSGIAIKVLGTTFNVKSYDDDGAVETTLVEGKVMIEKKADENADPEFIELFPDHKATFTKNSKQIVLAKVKPESETAWVTGSLVFEDALFSDIVKDLERWYGVKIILKDQASLKCRFNTRIENESLEAVLKLFSSSSNIKYRIQDDRQVLIEGSLCDH